MYTFERKQVGRRNMWIREWHSGNYSDVVRYDFVSYDTCIGIYFPGSKILYVGGCACYSATTRQHASIMVNMVNELADTDFDYYDVKGIVKSDFDIRVDPLHGNVQMYTGLALKDRMQCDMRYNKDYCNEIWGAKLCPM